MRQRLDGVRAHHRGYAKRGIAVRKDHKPGLAIARSARGAAHDALLGVVPGPVDDRPPVTGASQRGEFPDLIEHGRLIYLFVFGADLAITFCLNIHVASPFTFHIYAVTEKS
jgi:hypothetical protein